MGFYKSVYSKVDYRVWMVLPPLIGLMLLPFILNIPLGIDFTGGTELQMITEKHLTAQQISFALSPCVPNLDPTVQAFDGKTTVILRTKGVITKECLDSSLSAIGFSEEELKGALPTTFKPELGKTLLEKGSNVLVIAAILMMIIVFIAFRSFVPSIAVIEAAALDMIIGLGILSFTNFELTLPGFAALLMLIGYSIDTDIMLTSKVLKQTTKPFAEILDQAFITGMTMTGTMLAAFASILVVTHFVRIDTISQIASVLFCGLSADILTTWFTNAALLEWYIGRPKKQSKRFKFSIFRS